MQKNMKNKSMQEMETNYISFADIIITEHSNVKFLPWFINFIRSH